MRRTGLQTELLLSLVLVMVAASLVLAVVLFVQEEAHLRELLGRSLLTEARTAPAAAGRLVPGTLWWRIRPDASVEGLRGPLEPIDAATRRLAVRAREQGAPLVLPGAPWHPIRFAAPESSGSVVAARLPRGASWRFRAAPLVILGAVLFADVIVFAGFGMSLLRRRVVLPLRRLAAAARSIADGAFEARVPVEGPREPAEVASAFNEMTEALERRTRALEKAVVDLREANRRVKESREGLARAQRLAAVGRLAAGVAHEVGNPIGAMLALMDLASRDPCLGDAAREHLGRAAQQGERVRRILRQLLEFSRPPQTARVSLNLTELAEEAVALVSAQRRYAGVRFEVEREGAVPPVRGDPGAVSQILLNLLLNAADAVAEVPQPRVWITVRGSVREVRHGESRVPGPKLRASDTAECVVADNGPGIPEEDRDRIFDPFFTTKPPGEGTGLGLANSARLAEELGGTLEWVASPPGAHTAFALQLRSDEDSDHGVSAGSVRRTHCANAGEVRNGLRAPQAVAGPALEPETKS